MRNSRSSRSVSSERIVRRGQLSHSTPQDLDQGGGGEGGGGCRSWRSNDGLITPVSGGGCSPYQTPGGSPAIVAKFQPHFLTRLPAISRTTRRALLTSDSVNSLNRGDYDGQQCQWSSCNVSLFPQTWQQLSWPRDVTQYPGAALQTFSSGQLTLSPTDKVGPQQKIGNRKIFSISWG